MHHSKIITCAIVFAALFCLAATAAGQIRAGVSYLKVIPGTRQLGMAGTLAGRLDDMSAVYANPGATGLLREWQWSASYTRWIPDVFDASVFYGSRISLPWSRQARWALGLSFLGIKDFDSTNGREPVAHGNELLATASFGQPVDFISTFLSLGASAKYYRSSLDQFNADAVVFDAGLFYRTPRFDFIKTGLGLFDEAILSAGFSISQMGSGLQFQSTDTPLPRTVRLGMALSSGTHRGLQVQLAADYRKIRDEDGFFSAGTEISWQHLLFARGGYFFESDNVLGHLTLGMSLGFDDVRSAVSGRNNALRIDFAKAENNTFFSSPARGSISHFPIRPEPFDFRHPLPGTIVAADSVALAWESSREPDLFDAVNYLLLVDQNRTAIEHVLNLLDNQSRSSLIAAFVDSAATLASIAIHRIGEQHHAWLTNLSCGKYFWTVVAFDKDRHFRTIGSLGNNIADFAVGFPDLTIETITPHAMTDGCESRADIVVANIGNAAAGRLALSLYNNGGKTAELADSTSLLPGGRYTFRDVLLGTLCSTQPVTAWVNRDLTIPECDTTNNRKQQAIEPEAKHDLMVSRTADRQQTIPGEKITYTLTVQNNSCCAARDVVLTDEIPIFLQTSDFDDAFPVDTTKSDRIAWKLGTLPAHSSVTVKYTGVVGPFSVRINFRNNRFRWTRNELIDYVQAQKDMAVVARRLHEVLQNHQPLRLNIAGYTSSPGSEAYNALLSENRAVAIQSELIRRLQVLDPLFDAARITAEGRGEAPEFRKYVDDTKDTFNSAGRIIISRRQKQAANRRVEIEFFDLPEIIAHCEVKSLQEDINPDNNKASTIVKIHIQPDKEFAGKNR